MLLEAASPREQKAGRNALEAPRRVIEQRVKNGFGLTAERVRLVNYTRQVFIEVDLPGLTKNIVSVESVVRKTGHLTVVALGATQLPTGASTKGYNVLASSKDVVDKDVRVATDSVGAPAVNVTVRDPGATAIHNYTQSRIGQNLGIAIDGRIYDSSVIKGTLSGVGFRSQI